MILPRPLLFVSLTAFTLILLAQPHAGHSQNAADINTVQNTIQQNIAANPAQSAQNNSDGALSSDQNTASEAAQRPVPKRLSAQERWNRLSPEDRHVIINEWLQLDETIRPVFPTFRDNALEQQALQGNLIGPSQTPAQTSASISAQNPAPNPTNTSFGLSGTISGE